MCTERIRRVMGCDCQFRSEEHPAHQINKVYEREVHTRERNRERETDRERERSQVGVRVRERERKREHKENN